MVALNVAVPRGEIALACDLRVAGMVLSSRASR
jgi:hypothetical protein